MTYSPAHLQQPQRVQCFLNSHSNSARVASRRVEIAAACIGQAEAFTITRIGPTNLRRHQSGLRAYRIILSIPIPKRNISSEVIGTIARPSGNPAMTVRFRHTDTSLFYCPKSAQLHSEAA